MMNVVQEPVRIKETLYRSNLLTGWRQSKADCRRHIGEIHNVISIEMVAVIRGGLHDVSNERRETNNC